MDELKPGQVRITSNEGRAVEIETIPCQHQCDHGRDHKVGDVADWGRWGDTHVGLMKLASVDDKGVEHWTPALT